MGNWKKLLVMMVIALMVFAIVGCSSTAPQENSSSQENNNSGGEETPQQEPEQQTAFYEGKTLEILVPFSAGGGTDTLFRFFQPYLNKYVEGNPTVQVINKPGGGSVLGANEYVDMRKPDGFTALATSASTKIPFLIGQPEVHYDLREFKPIVGMPNGVVMYTSPDSGVSEAKDLLDPPEQLVLGATSPTGIDVMTLLAFEVLGIEDQVQIIFGYEGAGASRTAFLQGETNLDYQSGTSYLSNVVPLVEEGEAVPLFTYGFAGENGDIVRDPAFPDIPTVKDVYVEIYGEEPSGEAWDAYRAIVGVVNGLHKTLWIHGDAPEEAVNALREAVQEAIKDPEFQEGAANVWKGYSPLVGEDLQASINSLVNISDETLDWVSNFLQEEYDVEGLK